VPLDPKLLEGIACPKYKGPPRRLKPDGSALVCQTCRLAYPVVDDIPDLIVEDAQPWHTEKAVDQRASSVAFYTEMATAYGAYPNVIWEPYNEPNGFQWDQIKPYHQAVVDAVRKVDPDNLIVLGTPNWSQYVNIAAADPVAGSNLLYTLHWYSCAHGQHFRDLGDRAIAAALRFS
jgi:uncharacterized protein YbaR (Trm112 family)